MLPTLSGQNMHRTQLLDQEICFTTWPSVSQIQQKQIIQGNSVIDLSYTQGMVYKYIHGQWYAKRMIPGHCVLLILHNSGSWTEVTL